MADKRADAALRETPLDFSRALADALTAERERALTALREGEEHFRAIAQALPGLVFAHSCDGRITFVNRGFCEFAGRAPDALLNHRWSDLIHSEDADKLDSLWGTAVPDAGPVEAELRFRRADGAWRWHLLRSVPQRNPDGSIHQWIGTATDITERVCAEERLRRNHDTFYHLIKNNPFGVYVVDADFRLREVSLGAQKVFSNVRPLIGRDFAEVLRLIWPEPFSSEAIGRFRHTLETGEPYTAPSTVERRADIGEVEAYDWRIERITLPDGRFGVVCYFYDLSERQRWEAALRESEERFRAMADGLPLIVWMHDARGRQQFVNATFCEFFGVTREELQDGHWQMLMHPDDRSGYVRDFLASVHDRSPFHSEVRVRRADGAWRWMESWARPRWGGDGEFLGHVGTSADVTERKQAEEALRLAAERDQFRAELADALRLLRDAAEIEAAASRVLGKRLGAMRVHYASVVAGGEYALVRADYRREGVPSVAGRHRFDDYGPTVMRELAAGRTLVVTNVDEDDRLTASEKAATAALGVGSYVIVPLGKRDRPVAVLAVHHARPHRWTAAEIESIEETADRTWAAVERAHAEQALREADRRKDEFLATLAHELRNPLAPILNAASIIRLKESADPDLQAARDIIDRQVQHMVRLVDDLLDVSRITRGKLNLRRQRVALADVVAHAVETQRPKLRHELSVSLPAETVYLDADPDRLGQVFANLLNNACKYTPNGGRISVTAELAGGTVLVRVTDTGIGISAEDLPSLFQMFSQVGAARERAQEGLGIGLALTRALVEMHGGTIEARSDGLGKGAEFTVRLPVVVAAAHRTATDDATSEVGPVSARRVLLADDNRDATDSLAMMLRLSGVDVETAYDGVEAVRKAEAFKPDAILLDVGMPRLDGYSACRLIREQPWGKGIRIVALTGWGQEGDRQRSKQAGFDAHLVKPVEHEELIRLLASAAPDQE